MTDDFISGPVPFGVREDGSVLEDVYREALLVAPPLPENVDPDAIALKAAKAAAHWGVDDSVIDPAKLNESGWAVLFAPGVSQDIKDALDPLIEWRRLQVQEPPADEEVRDPRRFIKFDGDYVTGESAKAWLTRHNTDLRTVTEPWKVPYYVLIVGSPLDIPFEFQYELDIFYAVGRIWFDTPDEFRQYADSVVKYEKDATVPTSRQVAFFAACNQGDYATRLLTEQVANPLVNGTDDNSRIGKARKQNFALQAFLGAGTGNGDSANKDSLLRIMRGDIPGGRPALLFTGSHGKSVMRSDANGNSFYDPADDSLIAAQRGALLCQEWVKGVAATDDQIVAASDIDQSARVHGMIHFMFACYGVGWPEFDTFSRTKQGKKPIASQSSLSSLPRKLLSHSDGGALAVVGHIDRAWGYSFASDNGTAQNGDFRMILNNLMSGVRIGHATDKFNTNWGALSHEISDLMRDVQNGDRVLSPEKMKALAIQWVARDDARNYIVFGDPAVRLRTEVMDILS